MKTRLKSKIEKGREMVYAVQTKAGEELNRIYEEDLPVHEWYRFVLSYPPHLVRRYIEKVWLDKSTTGFWIHFVVQEQP